jgi:hypothetical protein
MSGGMEGVPVSVVHIRKTKSESEPRPFLNSEPQTARRAVHTSLPCVPSTKEAEKKKRCLPTVTTVAMYHSKFRASKIE